MGSPLNSKRSTFVKALCVANVVLISFVSLYGTVSAFGDMSLLPSAGVAVVLGDGIPYEEYVEISENEIIEASLLSIPAPKPLLKVLTDSTLNAKQSDESEPFIVSAGVDSYISEEKPVTTQSTDTQIVNAPQAAQKTVAEKSTLEGSTAQDNAGAASQAKDIVRNLTESTVNIESTEAVIAHSVGVGMVTNSTVTNSNSAAEMKTETEAEEKNEPHTLSEVVSAITNHEEPADEEANKEASEEEQQAYTEEQHFKNLVIANVSGGSYVNVRSTPGEDGEILGKLFDKSVGEFVSEENEWYLINSGNVTGFVKAEFVVTGEDAVALAKKVGTRMATVNTQTLYVRQDASVDSSVLGMVPDQEELLVIEELDDWVKVSVEEGDGYVSKEFVKLHTEFIKAESKSEEEARLKKERQEREAANAAANTKVKSSQSGETKKSTSSKYSVSSGGSDAGRAVAEYGLQFVGNPYKFGGTSLTNGADCSGFVMSVYANFGVRLPHSSSADRSVGSAVSSLSEAVPGDLICYSGHVALYIGNGQIVHASTAKTGIVVSNASYRTPLAIRRVF